MNVAQSLERYGTITFGIEYMMSVIRYDPVRPWSIDADIWSRMIPTAYLQDITPIVLGIATTWIDKGEMATVEALHGFIGELCGAIERARFPRRDPRP